MASIELGPRQQEIYNLIVSEALTNEEIAQRLGIAKCTVNNRIAEIFEKTGARRRDELIVWHYRGRDNPED